LAKYLGEGTSRRAAEGNFRRFSFCAKELDLLDPADSKRSNARSESFRVLSLVEPHAALLAVLALPRKAAPKGRFTPIERSTILETANLPQTTRFVCATDANCQTSIVLLQDGTQGRGLPKAAGVVKIWMLSHWCQRDSETRDLWHGKCDRENERSILTI
jgi:hypothetical protein